MVKPTKPAKVNKSKPQKPYPEFPLFPHATGRWAKKVRGKLVYFGKIANDPEGKARLGPLARAKGRPASRPDAANKIRGACPPRATRTLHAEQETPLGRLRTQPQDVRGAIQDLQTGRRDFWHQPAGARPGRGGFRAPAKIFAKQWGPVRLGNEIQRVRSVFKFGYESALIDRPIRFGPTFRKPSRKVMRLNRAKKGPRMFEAPELRSIIATAGVPLKGMILLGINCGFGNSDVAGLPTKTLDLKPVPPERRGWVDFARPKTGIERRCPLWPETVAASRPLYAIGRRPRARPTRASSSLPDAAPDGAGPRWASPTRRPAKPK